MTNVFSRIKEKVESIIKAHRLVVITIEQEGVIISRFVYNHQTNFLRSKRSMVIEKNPLSFARTKIAKAYFSLLFFPFPYSVMCIGERMYIQSSYMTLTIPRKDPQKTVDPAEITSALSKEMLSHLDEQKRIMMTKYNYDELRIVLVDNKIIQAFIDTTRVFPHMRDVLLLKGRRISLGMVQTLMHRDIFEILHTLLPRRAKISLCAQENFNVTLSLYLSKLPSKKVVTQKKFLFAKIQERETNIYICDGSRIEFYDSFHFGWKSFYETLHHSLGIELTTFRKILVLLEKKLLSRQATLSIRSILDAEMTRCINGLNVFEKQARISTLYVDGGVINPYLRIHKTFSKSVISQDDYNLGKEMASSQKLPHALWADIRAEMYLQKKNILTIAANRMIRWLLPHHMDLS